MEYHVSVKPEKSASKSKKLTDLEIERNKVKELVKEVKKLKTKIEELEERMENNREDYKNDLQDKDKMIKHFRDLYYSYAVKN